MRNEKEIQPIIADKRQNTFCQNYLWQLLLSAKRYAVVSKEKRKVL